MLLTIAKTYLACFKRINRVGNAVLDFIERNFGLLLIGLLLVFLASLLGADAMSGGTKWIYSLGIILICCLPVLYFWLGELAKLYIKDQSRTTPSV